jgi:hypothetical protein
MKNKISIIVAIALAVAFFISPTALAADDGQITAHYGEKTYTGMERECKEQAARDFGGTPCDYEYLPKTHSLYNMELYADKRQFNLDAYGFDLAKTENNGNAAELQEQAQQAWASLAPKASCEPCEAAVRMIKTPLLVDGNDMFQQTGRFVAKNWLWLLLALVLAGAILIISKCRRTQSSKEGAK